MQDQYNRVNESNFNFGGSAIIRPPKPYLDNKKFVRLVLDSRDRNLEIFPTLVNIQSNWMSQSKT
jgi:hypothetical protein